MNNISLPPISGLGPGGPQLTPSPLRRQHGVRLNVLHVVESAGAHTEESVYR